MWKGFGWFPNGTLRIYKETQFPGAAGGCGEVVWDYAWGRYQIEILKLTSLTVLDMVGGQIGWKKPKTWLSLIAL